MGIIRDLSELASSIFLGNFVRNWVRGKLRESFREMRLAARAASRNITDGKVFESFCGWVAECEEEQVEVFVEDLTGIPSVTPAERDPEVIRQAIREYLPMMRRMVEAGQRI